MRLLRPGSVLALVLLGAVLASLALAAPVGQLTYQGRTAAGLASLNGATDVAVSPDGTSVYVASDTGTGTAGAVVHFARVAQTGELTYQGCYTSDSVPCGTTGSVPNQAGLNMPSSVAVSPNGQSVYVAAAADSAVVHFDRDQQTGALSRVTCFSLGATTCPNNGLAGLGEASGVAVSPGGDSVYAVAATDGAIVRFDRASDGALTYQGCLTEAVTAACGIGNDAKAGLGGAADVVVSPSDGGASVYVAGMGAVVRLARNTQTGAIGYVECFTAAVSGCATNGVPGLAEPSAVDVSPDGANVYVAATAGNAVVIFGRAQGGALTPQGCFTSETTGCPGGNQIASLLGASGVDVSPDGRSLYVASPGIGFLSRFDRNPLAGGILSYAGCFAQFGCGAGNSSFGLVGASDVVITADGRHVYAAADVDNAVTSFSRAPDEAPACALGPPPSTSRDTPVQVATCSDPNGDEISLLLPQAPTSGTVALSPGGGAIYTPAPGFVGSDSFSLQPTAFGRDGPTAQVTVNVSAPTGGGTTAAGAVTSTGSPGSPGGSKAKISGLTLTRSFKALRAGASLAAKGPATVAFSLNVASRVTFRIEKLVKGRKLAGKCVVKAPKGSACTAVQTIAGRFGHLGKAGGNKVFFTGRIGGRALLKGNYKLIAVTEAGNQATATFSIR